MKLRAIAMALFVGIAAGFSLSEWILKEGVAKDSSKPGDVLVSRPTAEPVLKENLQLAIQPSTEGSSSKIVQILAKLPTEELTAQGSITGKVVNQKGEAMGGVQLSLSASGTAPGFSGIQVSRNSLVEFVKHRSRLHRFQHATRQQTSSASDGRFEFSGLPDARYSLKASLPGYSFEVKSLDPEYPGVVCGARILIIASSMAPLMVDVRLHDGSQAKSAILKGQNGWTAMWSAKEPIVELRPGTHSLQAKIGILSSREQQIVQISSSGLVRQVTFHMDSASTISIEVSGPELEDSYNCYIFWLAADSEVMPNEMELLSEGQYTKIYFWRNSSSEKYRTPHLAAGNYWVGVGFVPWRLESIQSVELDGTPESLQFSLDRIPEDLCFRVQVKGSAGEGLEDLRLRIEYSNGMDIDSELISQGQGQYLLLPHIAPQSILQGIDGQEVILKVQTSEFGAKKVPLDSRDILVSFEELAVLEVEVVGLMDEENFALILHRGDDEIFYGDWQEGQFLVKAAAGSYQMTLTNMSRVIADREVTLSSGTQRLQFNMPTVFSLQVDYIGAAQQLNLTSNSGAERSFSSSDVQNEVAEFKNLPPGSYLIQADQEYMAVEVSANTSVRFIATPFNALAVSLNLPEGSEATAQEFGLRDGDLIVGMGTQLFESLEDLQTRFMSVAAQGEITFMVQRAGELIEITINPQQFSGIGQNQTELRFTPAVR